MAIKFPTSQILSGIFGLANHQACSFLVSTSARLDAGQPRNSIYTFKKTLQPWDAGASIPGFVVLYVDPG
ncbi:MAG: hypothetical protein KBG60_01200 [Anaerolineaceae bacterium]|nr:hypothetical protein [Anaerolineaceae bacterium]